jgi:HPt (histidine-containing phosphotransfer) domain-containing protein
MKQASAAARFTVTIEQDFAPMIPRFMENRHKELAAMNEANTQHDYETIRRLAHGMKGAGGSYGFEGLTTFAGQVEQAAKAADETGVAQGLASIAAYLGSVDVVFE